MKPTLVFIMGIASAGKTTLGKALANQLKYAFIDRDTVGEGLTEQLCILNGIDPNDRDSKHFMEKVRPYLNHAWLSVISENLRSGVY